jgi:hypothetical protein
MPDLVPAHVEAVADLVGEWLFRMHGIQSSCDHRIEATELLTSTDPAVHAALLDALVRAGVLEEDVRKVPVVGRWQKVTDKKGRTIRLPAERLDRRYVTEWEAL